MGNRTGSVKQKLSLIDFGIAVQEARESLGITVTDLARMIKAQPTTLFAMEAFGIPTRSKYFEPLCALLGLDRDRFIRLEQKLEERQKYRMAELKRECAREYCRVHAKERAEYKRKRYQAKKKLEAIA